MDLTLIPIDDLIKEISSRTEVGIIGYTRRIDTGDPVVVVSHWGNWLKAIGICNVIKDDLIAINFRGKDT